jgi:hypothetical protein
MQGIQFGGTEEVMQGNPIDGHGLHSLLKQLN